MKTGKMFLGTAVLAVVLLTAMSTAWAGWMMEEKNGDKSFLSEGKLKVFTDNMVIMFNGKTKEISMIDETKKIYSQATIDEYCETMNNIIKNAMANMPPEYRKMMEQMQATGSKKSAEVAVGNTGTQEKIVGFTTDKYRVTVNGDLYEEVFVVTDTSLVKDYEPLIPLMKQFSKCATASLNMMETSPEADPEYQKLIEKGFIVKTIRYANGRPEIDTNVVKFEKKDVPESEFSLPSGYKKLGLFELMAAQMQMED